MYWKISNSHCQPCWMGSLWKWVGIEGSEEQNKGTIGQAKPQTSWAGMACAVSAESRAAPHIRACLHSAGLLQSLTAGKTNPLLWAHSQEKATSASLSQRGRYSGGLSPTAAESNNRLVKGKLNGRWQETNCGVEKKPHIFSQPNEGLGNVSPVSQTEIKSMTCEAPLREEGQVYWVLDEMQQKKQQVLHV